MKRISKKYGYYGTNAFLAVINIIVYRNVDQIESKSLELEVETKLSNGLNGRLGYTLQHPQKRLTKQTLINSPKHLGKLNLSVPLIRRTVFAGMELQYTSPRRTLDGSDLKSVWLSKLTFFGQRPVSGLDLSLSIYHLFDRKYSDPAADEHRQNAIEQNGRNLRLKLTYRF